MKSKTLLITLTIICAFICTPTLIFAGAADPWCRPVTTAAPLDGGLTLLIAAGISYGAKKVYDKRKKDKAAGNNII